MNGVVNCWNAVTSKFKETDSNLKRKLISVLQDQHVDSEMASSCGWRGRSVSGVPKNFVRGGGWFNKFS